MLIQFIFLEQIERIELSPTVWKTVILTIIRYLHIRGGRASSNKGIKNYEKFYPFKGTIFMYTHKKKFITPNHLPYRLILYTFLHLFFSRINLCVIGQYQSILHLVAPYDVPPKIIFSNILFSIKLKF